jgi:predicted transcriptional regulator
VIKLDPTEVVVQNCVVTKLPDDWQRARLGRAFAKWRTARGIKREEVAVLLRKSNATIVRYEKGQTEPSISQVLVLDKQWPGLIKALRCVA